MPPGGAVVEVAQAGTSLFPMVTEFEAELLMSHLAMLGVISAEGQRAENQSLGRSRTSAIRFSMTGSSSPSK